MPKFYFVVTILLSLVTFSVSAQDLMDVSETGISKSNDPNQARKEIHEQIVEKVTMKHIAEMIGDKKAQKNIQTIRNKVIKQSGKYIPLYNHSKLEAASGGRSMTVSMKFSLLSLKKLLQEQGLLYEHEGPPVVLPMVAIVDKTQQTAYRWWVPDNDKSKGMLSQKMSAFHRDLHAKLSHNGFFLKNPLASGEKHLLPQVYQMDSLRLEDYFFLGEFFKVHLILKGDVRIENHPERVEAFRISVRTTALHTGNGRVIAEVARTFDTETGPFEKVVSGKVDNGLMEVANDLSSQLQEAWSRGTFGARLVKIVLRGNLSYEQMNKLRDQLQLKVADIKSIRERLFEPSAVTYEVDTTVDSDSLGEKISKMNFEGLKLHLDGVDQSSINLRVTGI